MTLPDGQVYQMLGRLESKLEAQDRILGAIERGNVNINDKLVIMNGSIAKAHDRITSVESEVITKKGLMKAVIFGGLGTGVSGAGIMEVLKNIFGGAAP